VNNRTVQHPPIFNHPFASQGLKDSLKTLLPAQTRREHRIVARLTTAHEDFGKTAPAAALREHLDSLYAKSEALARALIFGTLEILAELIEQRVTRLASKQGSGTGKPMAPGLRKQFLGGRVNGYVNLKASSMTEREGSQFMRFANAWAMLAKFSPSLTYLRRLDQEFAGAQKMARHLQFSVLGVAAQLIESTVNASPEK